MLQDQYGALVRRHRKQAGLPQAQLARRAKRSLEMIGRIERGEARPSFRTVEALARVLKTPVAGFFVSRNTAAAASQGRLDRLVTRLAGLSVQELEWADRLLTIALARRPNR